MARNQRLATYSPKNVNVSIGGIVNVTGWLSLSVDRNSDNTSTQVGADGSIAHTVLADDTGSCEITVQQTHTMFNLVLAGLQAKDRASQDITFFDIVITDKAGGVLCYLNGCHLRKIGAQALAQETGERTQMFHVDEVNYVPQPEGFEKSMTVVANATAAIDALGSISEGFNKFA